MTNESEKNPARRVDDKHTGVRVDWSDAPRFNALGIAETWSVTVEAEGKRLLSIGDQYVAGLDTDELEPFSATIRSCAMHLLSFIGAGPVAAGAEPAYRAPAAATVLTDERIDELAKPFAGMGGVEDYRAFARAIKAAVLDHAGVTAEPSEPLTIALGQGLIEIGQGHHGDGRLPAILFGRNGAGAVGVETEGNRVMEPGECIAAVTFENYQSLDVVVEKLGELRMRIWPDAPHSQLSYGAAPHYRGYAHLGIGAYVLNHSAAGEPPELAISIATQAQKAGRVVGDMRDNKPGELVQPKDITVRLRFENVAGLDALEQQLRFVRSEHFAQQSTADKASEVRAASPTASQAALDVLAERRRQVEQEGWTPEHDDKYSNCELARAAATYALCSHIEQLKLCGEQVWPWHPDWWKRTTYRRDLIKAGALILAEVERVDRAAAPSTADSAGTGAMGEGAEA